MIDDTIHLTISRVRDIVFSSPVDEAIEKLLPTARSEIQDALERMNRKKTYVAIVGPQGCGKSSLLNSLLFARRILPMGQGVTTNAICYVEDAGDGPERTEVTLSTGVIQGPLEIEFLSGFMDENDNPDNRKGVTEIHCFARSQFLADNTVFVDTPGFGSTKAWHDKKTLSFAKDIGLGIGVIRSEQLKESEVGFLKTIWPLSPRYIFVQNIWGEQQHQVEAQLEEHRKQLSEIANECGDTRPVLVLALNIHQGLEGATNNRPDLIERSGLARVREAIAARTERGGQRLEVEGQCQRIAMLLRRSVLSADRQIRVLTSDKSSEAVKAEHQKARAELKLLENEADEADNDFRRRHRNCLATFKNTFEKEISQIWREFRQRADHPDEFYAKDLESALAHCTSAEVQKLQASMDDIEKAYVRGAIKRAEAGLNLGGPESLGAQDNFGLEFTEWAGNVVAALGTIGLTSLTVATISTVITTVGAGGAVSAGLLTAFAAIPGAGWAVAAGLVGIGAAVRFLSRESKRGKLLEEVERLIKNTREQNLKVINKEYEQRRDNLLAVVGTHFKGIIAQRKKLADDLEAKVKLNKEDRAREVSDLKQKKAALSSSMNDIRNLLQVSI